MANFTTSKSFTKGKTEATAQTKTIYVTQGTLKKVRIRFFKGAEETVHIKLIHQNRQILPSDATTSYQGDDESIPINCKVPIGRPEIIVLKGWNTDASNDHIVQVELEIDPGVKEPVKGDIFGAWGW